MVGLWAQVLLLDQLFPDVVSALLKGGGGRFQRDHIERASHEAQIDAFAFNPHTYHCCTKDKLSLKTKAAVKGQAHGLYTQPFVSGSLGLWLLCPVCCPFPAL